MVSQSIPENVKLRKKRKVAAKLSQSSVVVVQILKLKDEVMLSVSEIN